MSVTGRQDAVGCDIPMIETASGDSTVTALAKRTFVRNAARWARQKRESIAKQRASRDYDSAKAYYLEKLCRAASRFEGAPMLVYQMGKVGSKSVLRTLKSLNTRETHRLNMPVYHVHFLTQSLIDEYETKRKAFLGTEKQGRLEHIWLYEYLRQQRDNQLALIEASGRPLSPGDRWKVVTLTRETVGRNVSNFFELVEVEPADGRPPHQEASATNCRYHLRSDPDFYNLDIEVDTRDLSDLLQVYLDKPDHDEPLTFFEQEIKGVLGVDVYATPFPTSQGYTIYETDWADILLIRVEDLNTCVQAAFKEFLGIDNFDLMNDNVGSEKPYAGLYRQFKESRLLPESYIDRMYASRYMQHFYTDQEIARFKSKWVQSRPPDALGPPDASGLPGTPGLPGRQDDSL
jgi:hypothetical protein